ncbi:MAG: hypothetical protein ABR874_15585 [Candidatus Sulfotelmatobacter sp.]
MGNEKKSRISQPAPKYRQVDVASLKTGRHGKHHALVQGIVQELVTLQPGSALQIPLSEVGGVGLANLRSAIHRAAASNGVNIRTVADDGNFYVWRPKQTQAPEPRPALASK